METGSVVSTNTLQRRLFLEFSLKSCKPAIKPCLTQAMKKKYLAFAKRYANWNLRVVSIRRKLQAWSDKILCFSI